jgi:5-methylcytosine-specific restriction endonuclease McrA
MDKTSYGKYLKIDCWQLRRSAYLRQRGKQCELCGAQEEFIRGTVQVHHLTYARLGSETDLDLIAVCDACHRAMHGITGGTNLSWIRQYVETQVQFGVSGSEKLGSVLIALDRRQGAA